MLTERQEQILCSAVAEYINLAEPVSSELLHKEHGFALSSATIRNELAVLSEQGYLAQRHTSSGRVPTDKGYRFLVDRLLQKDPGSLAWPSKEAPWLSQGEDNPVAVLQELSRELSFASSLFAAVAWRNLLWKEGWEGLFLQPEFQDQEALLSFTRFVQDFEKNIEEFSFASPLHISIGRENRFSRVKDFSILVGVLEVGDKGLVTFALLGPRRMAYQKNIGLMTSLMASLHGTKR